MKYVTLKISEGSKRQQTSTVTLSNCCHYSASPLGPEEMLHWPNLLLQTILNNSGCPVTCASGRASMDDIVRIKTLPVKTQLTFLPFTVIKSPLAMNI